MLAAVSSVLSLMTISSYWGKFEDAKLLNTDLDDDEVDFVVYCSRSAPPKDTPFPEKAEKFDGTPVGAASPGFVLSGALSVAVALELPPPKKLESPPPLEDDAGAYVDDYELFWDGLLARVDPVALKLASSLYLENGHLFSQALMDSVEVSKHFKNPKV
jgi:hypothetical protein